MNEQEVWVRMMAACIANPAPGTTEEAANGADAAVAEWRKRYGAKAEAVPADDKPWHKCSDRMPGDLLPRIVVDRDGCVGFARQMLPYSENIWLKPADSEIGGIVAWRDLPDAPAEFAWKPAPAPFKVGDRVARTQIKVGTVSDAEQNGFLRVIFDDGSGAWVRPAELTDVKS